MTREEARKAAEVMLAYADGKELDWAGHYKNCEPTFNWNNDADAYRIKPTPTYRPFTNAGECWEEMKKHEPFGWVITKDKDVYCKIMSFSDTVLISGFDSPFEYEFAFKDFNFVDGSVFGKQTEEG